MDQDPYANKALLGAMVRDAAKAGVHNADGPNEPDLQRINNILVCEAFVAALANKGCMVTRIPTKLKRVEPYPPNTMCTAHPSTKPDICPLAADRSK